MLTRETLDLRHSRSNNRVLTSRQASIRGPVVEGSVSLRIAEQTADGLYIVDHDGNFAFVNPAAVALF